MACAGTEQPSIRAEIGAFVVYGQVDGAGLIVAELLDGAHQHAELIADVLVFTDANGELEPSTFLLDLSLF